MLPPNDGLYLVDLNTNAKYLLVSLMELASDCPQFKGEHYISHATFSPDGKKISFFHLSDDGVKRYLRFCLFNVEGMSYQEIESKRTVSHYCWKDDNIVFAPSKDSDGKWYYSFYNIATNTKEDLPVP